MARRPSPSPQQSASQPSASASASQLYQNDPRAFDYATGLAPPPVRPSPDAISPNSPLQQPSQSRNRLRSARAPPPRIIRRSPSIRLRRMDDPYQIPPANADPADDVHRSDSGRRRSSSAPQRPTFLNAPQQNDIPRMRSTDLRQPMPSVVEEPRSPQGEEQPRMPSLAPDMAAPRRSMSVGDQGGFVPVVPVVESDDGLAAPATPSQARRRSFLGPFAWRRAAADPSQLPPHQQQQQIAVDEYGHHVVDMLDVIDPEVSTLSTLTNVQNSLFIPDLGGFLNRRPVYTITRRQQDPEASVEDVGPTQPDYSSTLGRTVSRIMVSDGNHPGAEEQQEETRTRLQRQTTSASITSALTDSHYAVLPHGVSLEGWTESEKEALNDHVRHCLHSRRAKMKRGLKGFGQYVRRPLGFLVTLYATLITLFGLAWVLFLIGWISVGSKQIYVINVIDYILVALFAIMGDGLAPFRAIDTYHMIYIAHYHHLTWSLRKKKRLPKLQDHNDLPQVLEGDTDQADTDQDEKGDHPDEFSVLTPEQQAKLDYHAGKFAKSHTFYKPHETETHHAFPLRLLVAIVVLLDFHSLFQIALGACTWGINYHKRPFALTTVILCCSLTCNITAGILITVGDRRTRKKEVVERMFRQTLTQEAMKKVEKRREREEREELEKAQERQRQWLARQALEERRAAFEEAERKREIAERTDAKGHEGSHDLEKLNRDKEMEDWVARRSGEWVGSHTSDRCLDPDEPDVSNHTSNSTSRSHTPVFTAPTSPQYLRSPRSLLAPGTSGPQSGSSTPLPVVNASPLPAVSESSTTVAGSGSTTPLRSSLDVRRPADGQGLSRNTSKSSRNKLYKPPTR